jgi:hypothetical protein
VDESGLTTDLLRRYGRSPRGWVAAPAVFDGPDVVVLKSISPYTSSRRWPRLKVSAPAAFHAAGILNFVRHSATESLCSYEDALVRHSGRTQNSVRKVERPPGGHLQVD